MKKSTRRARVLVCGLLLLMLSILGCEDAEDDCESPNCRQFYDHGNYCTSYC